VDLPIECSFLIPLIKCWESLVCLIEKTWVISNVWLTKLGRHTIQREKYVEGNLPTQTLSDNCSVDDGSSPRTYSQKLGQAHNNQPTRLLQLTFVYKKVFYLSGGVFACEKEDWAEEERLTLFVQTPSRTFAIIRWCSYERIAHQCFPLMLLQKWRSAPRGFSRI
jgi:hypothetical protein